MALMSREELAKDILAAKVERRARWVGIQDQISRYHGPAYNGITGVSDPENYGWQFATHTVARLTAIRPSVTFTSRRQVSAGRVEGLEDYVRKWQSSTSWEIERERSILDMCFGQCVVRVDMKAQPGMSQSDDPIYAPVGHRMAPQMFGIDLDATSPESARFMFNTVIVSRNDFLKMIKEEDGWDVEKCRRLSEQSVAQARNRENDKSDRRAIVYDEVWCPFDTTEEMDNMDKRERSRFHGVLRTLSGDGTELRKPRGYFGPRQGPFVLSGFMFVPDQSDFIGPLTACDGQIRQLNDQARVNDKASASHKHITLVDANTPDGKMAILNATDGDVVGLPGFSSQAVADVSIGGIDHESRARELELRVRTDRSLGMSDAFKGDVTGVGTASENVIAAQSAENINSMWKRKVRILDEGVALRVAWFADQDSRVVAMAEDGGLIVGGIGPDEKVDGVQRAFTNGLIDRETRDEYLAQIEMQEPADLEQSGGSFDDLEIVVEMVGSDPAEVAKMRVVTEMLAQWLPILPQIAPYAGSMMSKYFQRWADATGWQELSEIDMGVAAHIGMSQAEPSQESQKPARKEVRLAGQIRPGGNPPQKPGAKSKPEGQAMELRSSAQKSKGAA